jgi:hypothetical protein
VRFVEIVAVLARKDRRGRSQTRRQNIPSGHVVDDSKRDRQE